MNKIYEKKQRRKSRKKYDSISYTTGNIQANIDHFNKAMGSFQWGDNGFDGGNHTYSSDCTGCDNVGEGSSLGEGLLTETKRYVRRYYIRPQNIFCSNKAEIVKALIDLDDANCSVYTLNNLGDEKDVSKLMSSDIIYYYDDGILYDKNRVKVMDYDLSIKKEENRKHFANIDKAPEKEFKAEYEDRMTDATELEENYENSILSFTLNDFEKALQKADGQEVSLGSSEIDEEATFYNWYAELDKKTGKVFITGWGYQVYTEEDGIESSNEFDSVIDAYDYLVGLAKRDPYNKLALGSIDEAFKLDFDDINVFGEKLTEAKENFCCICGEPIEGYGNNPEPFMSSDDGRCCDGCNLKFVIPLRIDMMKGE
jgi:hypothetical protein